MKIELNLTKSNISEITSFLAEYCDENVDSYPSALGKLFNQLIRIENKK